MITTVTFFCSKCGVPKAREALQPSTDALDRFRVGICDCSPGDRKGHRPLVGFALTPPPTKASWKHEGGTRWCKECKDGGAECTDPRLAPNKGTCLCGHELVRS